MQSDNFVENEKIKIKLKISNDKMFAYANIDAEKDVKITKEYIKQALEKQGIVYGINEEEIENFCEKGLYGIQFNIAKGVYAQEGTDGEIKYLIKIAADKMPKEDENGFVDYKNLDYIINVEKDQKLCTLIDAVNGVNGINIFGQEVMPRMVKEAVIPIGKNTYLSEDNKTLYAKVDGCVEYVKGRIEVEETYIVYSDVGPLTGNINFNGAVIVKGSVREGFTIEAKKDVTVEGIVEGANIISGGNIVLKTGINGMNIGRLVAKEDIMVSFAENATIECEGSFYSDSIIKSNVIAKENIILKGKKGSILGGLCVAGKLVYAKNIGTQGNIQTEVRIDPDWGSEDNKTTSLDKIKSLEEEIDVIRKELDEIEEKLDYLKSIDLTQEVKNIIKTLLIRKTKNNNSIRLLKQECEIIERKNDVRGLKIVATGTIYNGVNLYIKNYAYKIYRQVNFKKIMVLNDEMTEIDLNSSDMI